MDGQRPIDNVELVANLVVSAATVCQPGFVDDLDLLPACVWDIRVDRNVHDGDTGSGQAARRQRKCQKRVNATTYHGFEIYHV